MSNGKQRVYKKEKDERYQRGLVYGLFCNLTGELYIGSTIDYEGRQSNHRKMNNVCMSTQIIERGDYEFYIIELYPCWFKYELDAREEYHRQRNDNAINKRKCYISEEDKKEYRQKYQQSEKYKEYHDARRQTQEWKDYMKEYQANWYQENKERIRAEDNAKRAASEELQQANRDRAAKWAADHDYLVKCECGVEVKYRCMKTHLESKAHERYLVNGPPLPVEERRKQCFDCECGGKYQYTSKAAHFRSNKHVEWQNKNSS